MQTIVHFGTGHAQVVCNPLIIHNAQVLPRCDAQVAQVACKHLILLLPRLCPSLPHCIPHTPYTVCTRLRAVQTRNDSSLGGQPWQGFPLGWTLALRPVAGRMRNACNRHAGLLSLPNGIPSGFRARSEHPRGDTTPPGGCGSLLGIPCLAGRSHLVSFSATASERCPHVRT